MIVADKYAAFAHQHSLGIVGGHAPAHAHVRALQAQMQGQSASDASSAGGASGKSDPAVKKAEEQNCGLVQNTRDPKRENIQMSLIIASGMQNNKRVTMMRVIAPIGVFLPTGVALEIDGEAVGRMVVFVTPALHPAFGLTSLPA